MTLESVDKFLKFCIFLFVTVSWTFQLFGVILENCDIDFLFKFYSALEINGLNA